MNNLTDQRELIVNDTHPRTLAPITYCYQDPQQFMLLDTFILKDETLFSDS